MKRLNRENAAVQADIGGPAAEPVPEAARRPLRELVDGRLLEGGAAERLKFAVGWRRSRVASLSVSKMATGVVPWTWMVPELMRASRSGVSAGRARGCCSS